MNTEETKSSNKNNDKQKAYSLSMAIDYIQHFSKTIFALVYIINGIAIGLTAFEYVHPSRTVAAIFGAISIAFSAMHLGVMVNSGVKYQSGNKKRK